MFGISGVDYSFGDMATAPSFGRQLARLRHREQLSQEALAERAGLSRNYIGLLESGRQKPSLESAKSLARALGVSLQHLIGEGSSIREDAQPPYPAKLEDQKRRKQKVQKLVRLLEKSSMRQLDVMDNIIHHILGVEKTGNP